MYKSDFKIPRMTGIAFIISLFLTGIFLRSSYAVEQKSKQNFSKPSKEELLKRLTPEQYKCSQENDTEKPFANAYWNHHADGIYVDVVSGEPLFSSLDKYDSGSGWPSFTKPIDKTHLSLKKDHSLKVERMEVRSTLADSHLGHVFDDGPKEQGGLRYCINSATLNFVPLDKMKEKNYGEYLFLFAEKKNWEIAILSGGCFWGVEELLAKEAGVIETQVGYTGGKTESPTYEIIKTGVTGHAESVRILFDPVKTSYEKILELFFKLHDPTTLNQQGNDKGTQYRSGIYFRNDKQRSIAEKMIARVEKSKIWKKPLVTELTSASTFYPAETYHQKYLQKNPGGYTCHFIRDIKF